MLFYDLFRQSPTYVEIKQGEMLFDEGDAGEEMFVLIEGKAAIDLRGRRLAEIGPGEFVGELAVIEGASRLAKVTAISDCKFVAIDKRRFRFLVAETPNFALEVMRVLANRLRAVDEVLTQDS